MPNVNERVDNAGLVKSVNTSDPIWFSNIDDLKYAPSQIPLSEKNSWQCSFSLVGGTKTRTYCLTTGLYVLCEMATDFQRVMDSMLGHLPGCTCIWTK